MALLRRLWLGTVGYQAAWDLQRDLADARARDRMDDCVLLLEHQPVYTIGRNGKDEDWGGVPSRLEALGATVVEVDRGGSVTFHGPGQLVAYPIVKLARLLPVPDQPEWGDVGRYVRLLEEAVMATVAEWGLATVRRPPYTGVWRETAEEGSAHWRKIAAIGVKLAHGVTTHGIGLNVTTDLGWFQHVIPCGITDGAVGSLLSLRGAQPRVEEVATVLGGQLAGALGLELASADDRLLETVARHAEVPLQRI